MRCVATVAPSPTFTAAPPRRCTASKPASSVTSSPMKIGVRPMNGGSRRNASIACPLLTPPGLASSTILPRSKVRPGDASTADRVAARQTAASAGACR